jgi:hypothetical protein
VTAACGPVVLVGVVEGPRLRLPSAERADQEVGQCSAGLIEEIAGVVQGPEVVMAIVAGVPCAMTITGTGWISDGRYKRPRRTVP